MRKLSIVIFLILFFTVSIYGQNFSIQLEHVSVKDGLSGKYVTSILQDKQGFMWFGTHNGLNRWDGNSAKYFSRNNGYRNFLTSDTIHCVFLNDDGKIWLGTSAGISIFDPQTEKFSQIRYNPQDEKGLSHRGVRAIFRDSRGTLWIGTHNGLDIFNPHTNTFEHFRNNPDDPKSLSHNFVGAIYEDSRGNLWIGTGHYGLNGGGLNKFDYETQSFSVYKFKPITGLQPNWIACLSEDKFGRLWVGTNYGVRVLDIDSDTLIDHFTETTQPDNLTSNYVKGIVSDDFGDMWVATFYGLNRYDCNDKKFYHYTTEAINPQSVSNIVLFSAFKDASGGLWFGTKYEGVNKVLPISQAIEHIQLNDIDSKRIHNNQVWKIHQDLYGRIWLRTDYELGYVEKAKSEYQWYPVVSKEAGFSPRSFVEDSNGTLFVCRKNSLFRLDNPAPFAGIPEWKLTKLLTTEERIGDLLVTRAGELVISVIGGFYYYNRASGHLSSRFSFPSPGNDQYWDRVKKTYEDSRDCLWFSTGNGLFRFNPADQSFHLFRNHKNDSTSLSHNWVNDIFQDSSTRLWITTENGLNLYNRQLENFTVLKNIDRFSRDELYAIQESSPQELWLTSNSNIIRYDPDKQISRVYSLEEGSSLLWPTYTSVFKSTKGVIYFGGFNGLIKLHPGRVKQNKKPPNIVFTNLKILNKEAALDTSIVYLRNLILPHNKNIVSIEFTALDYASPQNNQYAYKMDGIDADWVLTSAQRRYATYTNLNPGEYTFRVKGANSDGVWNKAGASINIIILPPWWRTSWAYAFYIIVFASVLYGTWRFQLNRYRLKQELQLEHAHATKLEEIDQMKSCFFANISHEFRTPLTLIQGPVKQMLSGEFSGNVKAQYRLILRNTKQLLQLINQLLDLSKIESGELKLSAQQANIVPFVKRITMSLLSWAERKQIRLTFQASQQEIILYFDSDKMEKIVTNLISNAIKFTPDEGVVEINVGFVDGAMPQDEKKSLVEISAHDSGIGMPADRIDHIFDRFYQIDDSFTRKHEGTGIGLALTKELVDLHHGSIQVQSEPGKGSFFTVTLPSGRQHLSDDEIIESPVLESDKDLPDYEESEVQSVTTFWSEKDTQRPNILIVEDNADMRRYIRDSLSSGYQINESENGALGFEEAVSIGPDLIISDVMMPDMDGFELCRRIKTDQRTSHIPLILLTARAETTSKIEGLETGADDYISKPFDMNELQVRIKNLLEQRRKLQVRFQKEAGMHFEEISITSADQKFLHKTINIILNKITDPDYSIEDISREVAISRIHLNRKLQALTGNTTTEFVRTLRLKRAALLISKKSASISEIAFDVGFNNLSYFARCFKNHFGCLPSEYPNKAIT